MGDETETESNLINFVSGHKLLFDKRVDGYRSKIQRAKVWNLIASEMGLSAAECQGLWNNLRSQYMAHRRKIAKTPSGSDAASKPYFRHQQAMQFNSDAMGEERTYSNVGDENPPNDENEGQGHDAEEIDRGENAQIGDKNESLAPNAKSSPVPAVAFASPSDHRSHDKGSKKRKVDTFDQELVKLLKEDTSKDDELAAFGNMVTMKLREIRKTDKRVSNDTQFKIHQVLHDAEMQLE